MGLVVCFGITFFGVREPASGSEGQDTPGALAISGASPAGSSSSVRGTGEILPTLVAGEAPAAHAGLSVSHFAGTPAGLNTSSAPGPCLGPEPGQRSIHPRLAPLGYLRGVLGYREVVKYSLAMTCFWLGTGGASPFLTRFGVQELGMSEGGAFILMLVLVSCAGLCAYPAGLLGDRFGKKPVMTVGLAFFAVAILAGSQAHSTGQIIPAIVFIGIGSTVPLVLNFPMLVDLIPVGRAGEFVGLGSMLWSIGQPLGALLGGTIADLTGGYWLTFVFAGLTILTALALLQTVHAQVTRPVPAPTGAALQPAS